MHTVRQKWLIHKKVYSYMVQFIEAGAEGITICMFRNHVDAYGFCSWLNGGTEPRLSRKGHEDLESWNSPPKEETEE